MSLLDSDFLDKIESRLAIIKDSERCLRKSLTYLDDIKLWFKIHTNGRFPSTDGCKQINIPDIGNINEPSRKTAFFVINDLAMASGIDAELYKFSIKELFEYLIDCLEKDSESIVNLQDNYIIYMKQSVIDNSPSEFIKGFLTDRIFTEPPTDVENKYGIRYLMSFGKIEDWGNPIFFNIYFERRNDGSIMPNSETIMLNCFDVDVDTEGTTVEKIRMRLPDSIILYNIDKWPDWMVKSDGDNDVFIYPFDSIKYTFSNCQWRGKLPENVIVNENIFR